MGLAAAGLSYFGSFWDKIQLEAGPNLIYSPWIWLRGQTQSQYILKNFKKLQKHQKY
jgi:hypothetical protein